MNRKGNVVLFHPSMKVGREIQNRISIPLGLLAIATPLDLAGYKVKIIDQSVLDISFDMLKNTEFASSPRTFAPG